MLSISLGVRNLITYVWHVFPGFVQELRFFFFFFFFSGVAFRVHWSYVSHCVNVSLSNLGFFLIFFFFLLCSYWIVPAWSDLSCLFPSHFQSLLSQSSELRFSENFYFHLRFFILFSCCNFVSRFFHSSWKNISVGTLKCLVVPASGLSWH